MRSCVWTLLLLLAGGAVAARAQGTEPATDESLTLDTQPTGERIAFSFVPRSDAAGPTWEITLGPDRSGTYRQAGGPPQPVHVGEAVWKRLQSGHGTVRSGHCETRQKGLAQTGRKTLTLGTGADSASCTYNYSDDGALNDVATAFLAVAETLQEGVKLQHDHRFDRLALDADMDLLVQGVASGRALEAGNIAPVLQALVDDDRVIDRVRRKAARLLQDAGAVGAAPADKPR